MIDSAFATPASASPSPEPEAFGKALVPGSARHKSLRQLHALLEGLRPFADLAERTAELERLARWVRLNKGVPALPDVAAATRPQIERLRLLSAALERFPEYGISLSRVIGSTLRESSGLQLLGDVGLPGDRTLMAETLDRLSSRFLPEPNDERNLTQLLARLFPSKRDLVWLASLPDDLVNKFAQQLAEADASGSCWAPLTTACVEAIALLSTRVSAVGLSEVIRVRSPEGLLRESPFFRLPRACDELSAVVETGPMLDANLEQQARACCAIALSCRSVVGAVVENLEQRGVSVDVVYRLELITKSLQRLEQLIEQLVSLDTPDAAVRVHGFVVQLSQARLRERSLQDILRSNLHLLARKIIERAGHTGEHYITTSSREYFLMLASAGGGGVLTVGTTAIKYLTVWAHFAPFVEGMLSAANYAGSFIVMQLLGFTLATKQPSMTAAALAGSLRETAGHPDLSGLVATIARITRSQLAAAMGNVGLVIPSALLFDTIHQRFFGRSFLDEETAEHVLHSLHLTHSGSVFYAALTGVLLWTSSVGAGWLENWSTYRRLPEAIAEHRIGRVIIRRTTAWASRAFARNIAGVGGNSTLGFLLGMTPVMGKFFGIPLDVRHVTLSTGALTLAACTLDRETVHSAEFLFAAAGIAVIGLLNFGVSFVLALAVALRAREVDRSDRMRLLISVIVTFLRSPLQFCFPTKSGASRVHGPVSVPPPPHH